MIEHKFDCKIILPGKNSLLETPADFSSYFIRKSVFAELKFRSVKHLVNIRLKNIESDHTKCNTFHTYLGARR